MSGPTSEYLVEIRVNLPPDLPEHYRVKLLALELARGRELHANGTIRHIWRVPGAIHNVGVWSANDATELHELISTLPLFRYMTVTVTPLACHPVTTPS